MRGRFRGIYPILYTYFDAQERLDRTAMRLQVEACIRGGAHGIAILGFVGEYYKLTLAERRTIIDWVCEDVAGRIPVAVTVNETSVPGQVEIAKACEAAGAAWLILQPAQVKGLSEAAHVRFLGAVAERTTLPVGIQNNPGSMDIALSTQALVTLNRNHPNCCLMKGEGPILYVKRLVDETGGAYDIFNGKAGLELPNTLRAGCVGMVPAPDAFDVHVRVWTLLEQGRQAEAEALHRSILPLYTFMMMPGSSEHYCWYGKALFARRAGIAATHQRQPAITPDAFGEAIVAEYAAGLPSLAG
jgi:4-hydroxy-tetrahydrodipicolinate synthase